ncbi:thioester-containing protein 1 allele R1 isoform X1 [Stomoxys calcitrans]|uniref:thioester-containing protein 1 allele R1 isoform X1 n=1 Tax=Stomoxys calcitrans TaxID=35570 RepID=UPI0027E34AEF|nr:thioester-containing protein 1 allele R1 isoform X1 [Stomoxys calcitrans]
MYRFSTTLLVILLIPLYSAVSESYYSIVAPGTIRSNRNYSVCVSLHDAASPATIRLTLLSLTSTLRLSHDVVLEPYESKLIDFMPPKLFEKFQYALTAEGIKGVTLNDTHKLIAFTEGGPRVYIESDKGLYKPEDVVQFRVIILDENLQIKEIVEPIRIQILDAQRNRVKQFKDIKLDRGVFAAKFKLSKQPMLGSWFISVHISGKYDMNKEYTFKVEKYVLPKFSVHIENDRHVAQKNDKLKITVYGKYTYGKYVQGTVNVLLLKAHENDYNELNKNVEISDGEVKTDVFFDMQELEHGSKYNIYATLTERLTNISATAESEVYLEVNSFNIFIPESGIEFRDNNPYRFALHVKNWNGTPVRDHTSTATMHLNKKVYSSPLDENGVALFEFEYEPTYLFEFNYKDTVIRFDNNFVEQASNRIDRTNCKIKMRPRSSTDLSEPVEIEVSANHTLPYLIYTLTSHGNIVREEFIRVPPNQNSHEFLINVSMSMVPNSYLFVYYIIEDQLFYCEFTIRLPHSFVNKLAIAAPSNVKPGQNITLNVKGLPNSRVSIIAVDKSVLLLNSENVLRKDSIIKDLAFDRSYSHDYPLPIRYPHTPGYGAGLIILTNSKYNIPTLKSLTDRSPSNNSAPVRSIFPETWIFKDLDIIDSNTPLTLQVPDTITTWIVRAFSVNDETGFGIMDNTLDIEAFQPFFISVNLPYSVKRGEIVTIPVTIFNYLQQSHPTEITMENNSENFQLMDDENQPIVKKHDTRNITVPANNGKSVAFRLSPKKVGNIEIRVEAKNSITADAVLHKLRVDPEGIAHNSNQEELLTLRDGDAKNLTFRTNIPADIVSDSEYLVLSVSGDIMGTTLENLDDLVQMPTGCGEQNMVNLVPNILILDYLKSIDKFVTQDKLVNKGKIFIDIGYQQQLSYRHSNGAFSVFGPDRSTESNWLTAYVIRFFMKGMQYSAIEAKIVEEGLRYLSTQQLDDGSFPHRGHLFKPAHQNQYGFTAFVMLTFMEEMKYARKFKDVIQKGMLFLNNNINEVHDIYSLAIMANVYEKAGNRSQAQNILEKINPMAKEENGLKWWTSNNKNEESANDVEITAYILLALPETSGASYMPIFNWLMKQRNNHGGYGSTHDTVIGLQALTKYARILGQDLNTLLKVHYIASSDEGSHLKENILGVDTANELILQKEELPRNTRSVQVEVMGIGRVYLQFAYQYFVSNLPKTLNSASTTRTSIVQSPTTPTLPMPATEVTTTQATANKHSAIMPQMLPTEDVVTETVVYEYFTIIPTAKLDSASLMSLEVCYTYQPLTEDEKLTNMVILEIQFPSGFTANAQSIEKLREEEHISRIDIQNAATKVIFYFEKLEGHEEHCLTILSDRGHEVSSLKPCPIIMYDFYNDKRRSAIMYQL